MPERVISSTGDEQRDPSLTTRVVRGAGWMFAGKFAGRALALIKLIILARLLAPDDFGLFGIMMLATMALETLTRTGFDEALIQFKEGAEEHLDTAWTLHILRGALLAVLILLAAPWVARFFDEPRVSLLLQVFCVAPLIAGFDNIGIIYFKKDLHFKKQVTFGLCVDIMAMVVGVVLAFLFRNVWALVGATLTGCVARVTLSYVLHPYRPRFRLCPESVRRLLRFGLWLTGSSILLFFAMKGDRVILGHLLGAAALGVFGMAYQLADLPASQMVDLLNNVMMPAYAKAQQVRERLRRAFLRVWELVVTVLLPLTAFMVAAAPELVLGIIGDDWGDAIMPLRILALAALGRALEGVTTPLFIGTGRPKIQFWKTLIRGGVTLALAYPLTVRYGVEGAAVAGLIGVLALAPMLLVSFRLTDTPLRVALKATGPGWLLAACTLVGVAAGRAVPVTHPLGTLALMSLCAALIALPVAWILYRVSGAGPFRLLREGVAAADVKPPKWMEL